MKAVFKTILLLAVAFSMQACSSTSDLKRDGTGKGFTVKNKSYDQVWEAALMGVQRTEDGRSLDVKRKPNITLQDKKNGRIEAETGMSLWSYGEIVGIFISPAYDAPEHKIEVESLSKMKTNVFSKNWEDQVIENIKKEIAK